MLGLGFVPSTQTLEQSLLLGKNEKSVPPGSILLDKNEESVPPGSNYLEVCREIYLQPSPSLPVHEEHTFPSLILPIIFQQESDCFATRTPKYFLFFLLP